MEDANLIPGKYATAFPGTSFQTLWAICFATMSKCVEHSESITPRLPPNSNASHLPFNLLIRHLEASVSNADGVFRSAMAELTGDGIHRDRLVAGDAVARQAMQELNLSLGALELDLWRFAKAESVDWERILSNVPKVRMGDMAMRVLQELVRRLKLMRDSVPGAAQEMKRPVCIPERDDPRYFQQSHFSRQ